MTIVRPAAVAGSFYPSAPERLRLLVDGYLAEAAPSPLRPKAFIVPHAGYVYSGPIAAAAYATLAKLRPQPLRVVLLGPAHHAHVRGLALPGADVLETPLGRVRVDAELVKAITHLPQVVTSAKAHEREHSLEVQLPFLQRSLSHFTVLPLAVGDASPAEVAEVLDAVWGGHETVVLISSDLSHYLSYEKAKVADTATAARLQHFDVEGLHSDHACGAHAIAGLLHTGRKRGGALHLLDLRSSGDTAGDKARVVGYGAFAFVDAPGGR